MYNELPYVIAVPIVQAIEDAILIGYIREIDGVLEIIKEDEKFPEHLRYGLEALLYFRMYYGKDGDCAPANDDQKQNVIRMEASWGRELIESMGHYPDLTEAKYA